MPERAENPDSIGSSPEAGTLTPFEQSGELDYDKLIKEFGTQPISSAEEALGGLPDYKAFNHGYVFSHRDFDRFMLDVRAGKRCAIVSGLNPSSPMHFGHKMTFDLNLFFQREYGIEIFIPLSDDESYVVGKVKDQEEALHHARVIAAQLIAMGFSPEKTHIFIDQQYTRIYNLAIKLSRGITLSTIKAVYGFPDSTNAGLMFYPCIQAAHLLMPQLPEFGCERVLVPIGIDQDPYVRVARDVAEKFGFTKPGGLHLKYLPGLKGEKMSASRPETAVFLTDDPKEAARKVKQSFTGGRVDVDDQRRLGGRPGVCVTLEYLAYFMLSDEERAERIAGCTAGENLCGGCKVMLAEFVESFLREFQEKVERAKPRVDELLLKV